MPATWSTCSGSEDCTGLGEPGTTMLSGRPEFVSPMPLPATVVSVGWLLEPPVWPALPASCCWNTRVSAAVDLRTVVRVAPPGSLVITAV